MAACLVVSLLLSGCSSWQTASLPADRLLAEEDPDAVRIAQRGDGTVTLRDPELVADSIVGEDSASRIAVPLDAVERIEVRRFSLGRTLLILTPVAVVTVPVVGLVVACVVAGVFGNDEGCGPGS